jgi:hypothetical protein
MVIAVVPDFSMVLVQAKAELCSLVSMVLYRGHGHALHALSLQVSNISRRCYHE